MKAKCLIKGILPPPLLQKRLLVWYCLQRGNTLLNFPPLPHTLLHVSPKIVIPLVAYTHTHKYTYKDTRLVF